MISKRKHFVKIFIEDIPLCLMSYIINKLFDVHGSVHLGNTYVQFKDQLNVHLVGL
jgi:hypothetical protein